MDSTRKYAVPVEDICWHCNMRDFDFQCTDELAPPQGLIGQERALRAIQFGLEVDKRGYNLFVTGLTGTGKASAIKNHLQSIIDERNAGGASFPLYDWCYVHNFADPDRPHMLRLPPGQGRLLHQRLQELLRNLREEVPKVFAAEEYSAQRKQLEDEGRTTYQRVLQELERTVRAEQFGLQFSPAGVNLFPLTEEGKPYQPDEFMRLPEQERDDIDEKRNKLLQTVQDTMTRLKAIEQETLEKVRALDREAGEAILAESFRHLIEDRDGLQDAVEFNRGLKEYTLNNLNLFTGDGDQPPAREGPRVRAQLNVTPSSHSRLTLLLTTQA